MTALIGGALGATLGFFGQCSSGTCPLTSTWWRGGLYGAVLGLMFHLVSGGNSSAHMNQSTPHLTKLSEADFQREVIQSTQPVLVDFYATWCGPCKAQAPVLEDLAQEYSGHYRFVKVNIDEAPSLAQRYAVQGVPTLMIFDQGKVVDSWVGLRPTQEIKIRLQRHQRLGSQS
jgi:thioredoxin 1